MKSKLLTLVVMATILSLVMVSAAVTFNTVTGSSQSVNPGAQASLSFSLKESGQGTITNLELDSPLILSGCSQTLSPAITVSGLPASLNINQQSGTITVTFTVSQAQAACSYTGDLTLRGTYGTTPYTNTQPITLIVTQKPSLSVSSATVSESQNSATLTITNTGNKDLDAVAVTISSLTGATFTINPQTIASVQKGQSQSVTIDVTKSSSLGVGSNIVTVTATASDGTKGEGKLTINKNFCEAGEKGNDLSISDIQIDNSDGDDEEWGSLDKITLEITVDNEGDDKISDVYVEIGLFNQAGKNIIKDMDDLSDEEVKLGSIQDGDEDTALFEFTVPADFEDETYKLVAKAYSKDLKESTMCTSQSADFDNDFYQSIDGQRETDEEKHIVFNNIQTTPSQAQCGERVQVTGEIFNIGDEDYEDQVKVTAFNTELKINTEKIIRQDFDQGDSELVDFEFDIPTDAAQKVYVIEFRTYYDYDEDDDDYSLISDERFTTSLRVEGNCNPNGTPTGNTNAQITAELDSETPQAVAGQQVIVNAVVKNNGNTQATYAIGVDGNTGWSTVTSIEPRLLTLAPGQSGEVGIVLAINTDATSDQEFTIRANSNGVTTEQKVVLAIQPAQQTSSDFGPVVDHIKENWFIYLIILVNVVLIIAIILVIRSMVTPTRPAM